MHHNTAISLDEKLFRWGRSRTLVGALIAAVALAWALGAAVPHYATVNGKKLRTNWGYTVAECARTEGLALGRGDLIDAQGHVLQDGGGYPAVIFCNGRPAGPNLRLRPGDSVTIKPAHDEVQPLVLSRAALDSLAANATGAWPVGAVARGLSEMGLSSYASALGRAALPTAARAASLPTPQASGPQIALTFDDGPTSAYTSRVLDILRKYHAHATFFTLGSLVHRHPELIRRMIAEGHEVGIHTWNHRNLTRTSPDVIRADIARCAAQLAPLTAGQPVRWVRPPYGAVNRTVRSTLAGMGYPLALWTLDTSDWRRPGSAAIVNRVMGHAHDGTLVLMHDGGGVRTGTVEALAQIIPGLQKRGYAMVTLSQLAGRRPVDTGEQVVETPEGLLMALPVEAGLKVFIDDQPIDMPVPPVEANGQLLLPVNPLLKLLGASYEYDVHSRVLKVTTIRGSLVLRTNDYSAQIDGREVHLQTPPILYRGTAMVPLWLVANSCQARVRYDATRHVLQLSSYAHLQLSPQLP